MQNKISNSLTSKMPPSFDVKKVELNPKTNSKSMIFTNLKLKQKIDFYIGGFILGILYFPIRFVGLILKRDHSLKNPKHIVVIKLLGGGSLFTLSPTLFHLKEKFPNLKISLIGSKNVKSFAEVLPFFSEFIEIKDHSLFSLIFSCIKSWWHLLANADVIIDLELHSRLTTALSSLSGVNDRIGLIDTHSQWRRRIYTHSIYVHPSTSSYSSYDALAQLFGVNEFNMKNYVDFFKKNIQTNLPTEFINILNSKASNSIVSLGLFCSDLAKERELPNDFWSHLIQDLLKTQAFQFIILGGPQDQTYAKKFIHSLPNEIQNRVYNACGKLNLKQSIKIIDSSDYFLGIDSALIHLSRFLEIPQIGFWGPTNPSAILHPTPSPSLHFYNKLSCSPCVHVTDNPPCQGENICMKKHGTNRTSITDNIWQFIQSNKNNKIPNKTKNNSTGNLSYLETTGDKQSKYLQNSWAYLPDGSTEYLELVVNYSDHNFLETHQNLSLFIAD